MDLVVRVVNSNYFHCGDLIQITKYVCSFIFSCALTVMNFDNEQVQRSEMCQLLLLDAYR